MRIIAQAVSIVFHPLLLMGYIAVLITYINPYLFGMNKPEDNILFILQIFAFTFFLPFVAVVMMKSLGFIKTLEMEDKKERIGPLIATLVVYLWMSFQFYKVPVVPTAFTIFMVGATLGLSIAFVINVFSKISLHALGVGGLLGMVIITMLNYSYGHFEVAGIELNMTYLLIVTIMICGLVGTSRLLLEAHEPVDLYGGFFVGLVSQFIALALLS